MSVVLPEKQVVTDIYISKNIESFKLQKVLTFDVDL